MDLLVERVDKWLWAARIFKTRRLAQEACTGGRVKINGATVKSAAKLKVGDELHATAPRGLVILKILELSEKRVSATVAATLFDDHSPPPPPREERPTLPSRDRGMGRPTKADRRAMDQFRRENDL